MPRIAYFLTVALLSLTVNEPTRSALAQKPDDHEMILNGWAVADHSLSVPAEIMARENKRGLWRGQFIAPKRWRKGEPLPGEK